MAYIHYKPKVGRHGVFPVYLFSEKIGTITSAATDTFRIPTPFRKAYVLEAFAQAQTVPVVTTGTSTATIKKYRAVENDTVTISSGLDLETLVANESRKFVIPSTTVESDKFLRNNATNGDTLLVEVVNGTTIATQPVALFFTLVVALLE